MAPNKDVVDIASAVGTCAAALIALVLGIGGALSSKRTARTSARLTAARLVPQINAVISALEAVSSHLKRCTALDWAATMTTSGVATFILAGSEESEAA